MYTVMMGFFQECPVLVGGNHEQKKKYLGRMIEEPLHCVRNTLTIMKTMLPTGVVNG